jgi:putative ABC transport system permease protein
LLLAVVGLYGLLGYSVQQRTKEISIRMAIGAQPGQVQRMVVREGMVLALSGIAAGAMIALAMARWIAAFLFGVAASDAVSFVTVAIILATSSLLAVWIPARRASRVDAGAALKQS